MVKYDPVVEAYNHYNNQKLFTDFNIFSKEGKLFPCHRFILASQSPAMMAMVTKDIKEKKGKLDLGYNGEVVATLMWILLAAG